ncbi:MAG: Rieske 2Fe-2S domain-containing protein [Terriglobia bacterium]
MSTDTNPAEPKKTSEAGVEHPSRRKFIAWALGIPGAIIACLMCVPLVRESLYPTLAKGAGGVAWSDLGAMEQYSTLTEPVRRTLKIQTVDGWRQVITENVVYVTKGADGNVEVLTAVCPHLGCEVACDAKADHFHCPCHGSVFAADGRLVSGPSPRGMDTLPTEVKNGRLMVHYEYFENLLSIKQVVG